MDKDQLRKLIREVLEAVDLYSASAEELLMFTAAAESDLGMYIEQVGTTRGGKGIFQMEVATCMDIDTNFLRYKDKSFLDKVRQFDVEGPLDLNLKGNIPFQIVRARLQYLRHSEPLPNKEDINQIAKYYKKYFNTYAGKARIEDKIGKYRRLVLES